MCNLNITEAVFRDAIRFDIIPEEIKDVKELTRTVSEDIIYHMYWKVCRAEDFEFPLSLIHFDTAIQHSPTRANRMIQETINTAYNDRRKVWVNGIIDSKTMDLVNTLCDNTKHLHKFCDLYLSLRLNLFDNLCKKSIKNKEFLDEWKSRVERLKSFYK